MSNLRKFTPRAAALFALVVAFMPLFAPTAANAAVTDYNGLCATSASESYSTTVAPPSLDFTTMANYPSSTNLTGCDANPIVRPVNTISNNVVRWDSPVVDDHCSTITSLVLHVRATPMASISGFVIKPFKVNAEQWLANYPSGMVGTLFQFGYTTHTSGFMYFSAIDQPASGEYTLDYILDPSALTLTELATGELALGFQSVGAITGMSFPDESVAEVTLDVSLNDSACVYHSVTFDANGGTGTMADQTSSYARDLNSASFTKTGYTFVGWATSQNGSVVYDDESEYSFNSDTTLFAIWEANSSGGGGLASTGFHAELGSWIAFGLLVAGIATVLVARRRAE